MPTVYLEGHNHTYPISDVLSMFCGMPVHGGEHQLTCGNDIEVVIRSVVLQDRIETYIDDGIHIATMISESSLPEKREIKRQLYLVLSRLYQKTFPWGSLTGIRPTTVAGEEGSAEELMSKYFVREDKARLAIAVNRAEERLLDQTDPTGVSLYLGIPFCPSRCSYCSFIAYDSLSAHARLDEYLEALYREVQIFFQNTNVTPEMIYVGGGTPTVFDDDLFCRGFEKILSAIPRQAVSEFTFEAGRADTVTRTKLLFLREQGVDRICINPQTTSNDTLRRIGRNHTADQYFRAFEMARAVGFRTINSDIIAGLPGESSEEFQQSLLDVLGLMPENITVHTLAGKRKSHLSDDFAEMYRNVPIDPIDEMIRSSHSTLFDNGYFPYYLYRQKSTIGGHENTGFSKPGHECRYNVAMMSDQRSIAGFGAQSMSKRAFTQDKLERCPNIKNPNEYILRAKEMAERKTLLFGMN